MYTVKQLSDLAQVSVRTLHYYDEIGLLPPSQIGENRYRYYSDEALLRLQQILFYREIGLELMQIKDILDRPDFNLERALRSHKRVLQSKIERLKTLVDTVDQTIKHLAGETTMSKKQLFQAFSEEEQKEYEREARLQYGPDVVNDSIQRWNSYGKAKQEDIMAEASQIYIELAEAIDAELAPDSEEVQAILVRWHENLRNFYEPTLEVLRGLGEHYNTEPRFIANFKAVHDELPQFLQDSISTYVDELETAELARILAEDEANANQG